MYFKGKMRRSDENALRSIFRVTDFFVHYISRSRYGPTCGARPTVVEKKYLTFWIFRKILFGHVLELFVTKIAVRVAQITQG